MFTAPRSATAASQPDADATKLAGARCLVLGAGGFLGTTLCRALCDQGAEVQGFGRAITYPEGIDARVDWITGRFADTTALAKAVQGQDFVFHLISGSTPGTPNFGVASDFIDTTQATLSLLEICRSERVRKVIFASSGGTVYGMAGHGMAGALPLSETAPTDPISAYGIGKLTIEKFLALYRRLFDLDYHILRISNPYGPYQSPLRKQGIVAALLYRALSGRPVEIWGDGEIVRDFIAVDDVARAFIATLFYAGPHKIMNVGSGIGRSINDVITDISDLLELPVQQIHKPGRTADVPANILDSTLIQTETGWRPTVPWPRGLAETTRWMRQQVDR